MYEVESKMLVNFARFKHLNEKKLAVLMELYDLRRIDIDVLFYLSKCDDKDTAKDISVSSVFTKGHISQSVKRLTQKGLIVAKTDVKDMRVQHLELTEKARPILEETKIINDEVLSIAFGNIKREELRRFKQTLDKMCDNIEKYTSNVKTDC